MHPAGQTASNATLPASAGTRQPRLLDLVRTRLRTLHYSKRTEESYVGWLVRFIRFHGLKHPRDLGGPDVERFLSHLATERHVAASTQNQALAAILFLYTHIFDKELPALNAVRAKRPQRLPVVLGASEIRALIAHLPRDPVALMVELLYGTGMRVLECCRLRVKDIDFDRNQITVREGKLDGVLRVGISPSLIQWLPSGRGKVFEENRDGYIWTPVRVSGTTDFPQEDLSKRLVQAAAGAVIDSLQNIQKNPQNVPNAVKGALDALKSILPGR